MRRLFGIVVFIALFALVLISVPPARAASDPVIPGATYSGKGTKLTVDVTGKSVRIQALPVHPKCKNGRVPTNEGDYGTEGLGPFSVSKNGTFSNLQPGKKPAKNANVIKGKFSGSKVSGSVVEPAFKDNVKNFDCAKVSTTWTATRVKGTGDTTKPGQTYAKDDFSKRTSGFDTFNETNVYAEYLTDGRFRIGTRSQSSAASLRNEPNTATADITVTTGYTSGSGGDGAGLACLGTGPTSFIAGYVSLDGNAHLLRLVDGSVYERVPAKPVPAGLLKMGPQAQNEVRMVCTQSPDNANETVADLYLNGQKVQGAVASKGGPGKTGVFVDSESGSTEFTFSNYVVRKPKV